MMASINHERVREDSPRWYNISMHGNGKGIHHVSFYGQNYFGRVGLSRSHAVVRYHTCPAIFVYAAGLRTRMKMDYHRLDKLVQSFAVKEY